jgi:hypothetical protein
MTRRIVILMASTKEEWKVLVKIVEEGLPVLHRSSILHCDGLGCAAQPGIFLTYNRSIPQDGNLLSMEGSMIDAVLNVAVFAPLVLCIVGFGTWAHRRVP